MAASRMVQAIFAALFQPNAETLAAFMEVERGGLQQFDSVDALFAELHAEN